MRIIAIAVIILAITSRAAWRQRSKDRTQRAGGFVQPSDVDREWE
jgi:hypothetical protein